MLKRLMVIAWMGLMVGYSSHTFAQEHVDANTDAEEMAADSEAALSVAKAQRARATKEQVENAKTLREANKVRARAEVKKAEADSELKRTESEIRTLLSEQARTRKDIQRFESETKASEKAIVDARARVEKTKGETTALQALRAEKEAKLAETNKSREEVLAQTKALEQQRIQAQLAFTKAKDEEVVEAQRLEKTKVDEGLNRVRLEKEIADLRERFKASNTRIQEMEAMVTKLRQSTARLETTAKTGQGEVTAAQIREEDVKAGLTPQQIQSINLKKPMQAAQPTLTQNRAVNAIVETPKMAAATAAGLVLRRDCKIHGGPNLGSPVLGVKLGGESIDQGQNENGWVAFPMDGEQKGFVAKSCF